MQSDIDLRPIITSLFILSLPTLTLKADSISTPLCIYINLVSLNKAQSIHVRRTFTLFVSIKTQYISFKILLRNLFLCSVFINISSL